MKYRRITAALAAIIMMTSAFSCGNDPAESTATESKTSVSEDSGKKSSGSEKDSADEKSGDSKSSEKTTESKDSTKDSSDKSGSKSSDDTKSGTTTTSKNSKTDTAAATTTAAKSSGNKSTAGSKTQSSDTAQSGGSSAGNSSSGGSSESKTTTAASGGNSAKTTTTAAKSDTPAAVTTQAPEEEPQQQEEDGYTAEVNFSSLSSVKGDNVAVSGSVVTISAGGDYLITGAVSDGQLVVDTATEEKVKIILNGADISCSSGPAIFINEAKKCTVEVADGSVNYLSDGGNDKTNDGVIFSNDTLRLKGGGTLVVTAGNAHGIASDDDVIIESGTYDITSIKSGIFAHDDITVNGGDLTVKGGTNGIKSKGSININGGTSVISGGTKEEKSSVYSAGAFNYTGGYVFAAGNQVSVPTTTSNPYIVVDLGSSNAAGSSVEMVLDGTQMVSFAPQNNFRCLMMLAPEISEGSTFYSVVNGSSTKEFTVASGQNLFTVS